MPTAIATSSVGLLRSRNKTPLSKRHNGENKLWGRTRQSKVTLPQSLDRPGESGGGSNNGDTPPNGGSGGPPRGGGGRPPGDGGGDSPDGGGGEPPDDAGPGEVPMSVNRRPRNSDNVRWICLPILLSSATT
ncbi:uncharacterized protein PG986_002021 [Apiospora aurea]|uniref:Uncharacterized protein n=1 Tax=Apiospora aurea TaxID=335848 RepID=A0ABR1QYP3_9PEZI